MIEHRGTSAPAPPYRGPIATAFEWIVRRIVQDEQVRTLVVGHERVAGPIELAAVLGRPRALPWLYLTVQAAETTWLGTGRGGGSPSVRNSLQIAAAAVVAGTDPTAALRIWDAIQASFRDGYRLDTRLASMWAAGISEVDPESYPQSLRGGPDLRESRCAAQGTIRVLI